MLELGFVATTFDGHMVFYELNKEENKFENIRHWHYRRVTKNEEVKVLENKTL